MTETNTDTENSCKHGTFWTLIWEHNERDGS